jgi:hypothetical protein
MTGVIGVKAMDRAFPLIHRELWEGPTPVSALIHKNESRLLILVFKNQIPGKP